MGKWIGWILAILVGMFLVVWFMKTPIMSSYLSKKLKVDVSIGGIAISSTEMKIDDFRMNNPKGFRQKTAFSTEKIQAEYSFSQLFGSPATIDQITLDDVYLGVICTTPTCANNNWTQIISGIQKEEEKGAQKEYLIKKLTMRNLNVEITGLSAIAGGDKKVTIPEIVFTNVNSKDGFPTQQLVSEIFKRAGIMDYIQEIIQPQKIIQDVFKPFGGFGHNEQALPKEELAE